MNEFDRNIVQSAAKWGALGAMLAGTSVAMGAFAAHGLKSLLSDYQLGIIETAATYQMYHAFAILLVALFILVLNKETRITKRLSHICGCFLLGTLLFSGSLYLLAITSIKWFAFVTPIGGLFLIIAWLWLTIVFFSFRKS